MPATAGHDALLGYVWEDNGFRQSPTDTDIKPFGVDATMTTKEGSNNATRLFNVTDYEAQQIIEQQFDGSWAVDFTVTNPWWLRSIFGTASSAGTSPTTHTFDSFPGDPIRIYTGNAQTSTYTDLEGCVATSATLTFNIPGTVDVSLEGAYAYERDDGASFAQPTINERALSHHDSKLDRGGSTLSFVQSLTVTINTNVEMVPELGDRFAADFRPGRRNTSLEYARVVQDTSDQERVYGGAQSLQDKVENQVDFFVEATNGKTGTDKNSFRLDFTDVFPDSASRTGIGEDANLEDELSELGEEVTATAENGTATAR